MFKWLHLDVRLHLFRNKVLRMLRRNDIVYLGKGLTPSPKGVGYQWNCPRTRKSGRCPAVEAASSLAW